MLFYWNVKEKNGVSTGGHNCTDFCKKGDYLEIKGYDKSIDYEGDYVRHYYSFRFEMVNIESVDFQPMTDEFDINDYDV